MFYNFTKNIRTSVVLSFVALPLVAGCAPDEIKTELYVGDIQAAVDEAEVFEVPIEVSFSILGDDDENLLPRAVESVKPYVHPDTEFSQSKGQFGDRMVVTSFIPLGTEDALNAYGADKSFPFAIRVSKYESGGFNVALIPTSVVPQIDQQLSGLNMMLGLDPVGKKTTLRVVNDQRTDTQVYATAVFVSKKPHLYFETDLSRRESVEILYKGGDESVYSEIAPEFDLIVSE
jgi:hypothetical protein